MKSRMKKILGFLTVLCLAAGILPLSAVPALADPIRGRGSGGATEHRDPGGRDRGLGEEDRGLTGGAGRDSRE